MVELTTTDSQTAVGAETPRAGGRILLVEDDGAAAEQMSLRLTREGYAVTVADSARRAGEIWTDRFFDVIILDFYLPDGDGEQVCAQIREAGVDTPILMLTARRALAGKVSALDGGADDYLTKPFAFDELFARLRALTRRGRLRQAATMTVDGMSINRETRTVFYDHRSIELTPLEFDLLVFFLEHPNRAISRQRLLAEVWTASPEASTNTVDVYIRYLRKKIWGGRRDGPIRTVRGVGYLYET